MAHISGKVGNVYTSGLLVDDGETAWVTAVGANWTCTADATVYKVGAKSAKMVIAAAASADDLLATSDWTGKDLSTYDGLYWWAYSTVATAAGDFQIAIDETAACAGPEEYLNFPSLEVNTWKQCFARFAAATTTRDLIISIGLHMVTDKTATIYVDDVEALAIIDGIKAWNIDYTVDTLETTDFASAGLKEYIAAGSGWAGSFDGYKDGVPLSIGSEVYLILGESTTAYQNWIGKAILTGVHPSVAHDGVVSYSYDFQGTGLLTIPGA